MVDCDRNVVVYAYIYRVYRIIYRREMNWVKMKLEREERKGEKVEGWKMRSRCTSHVTLQAAIPKGENGQLEPSQNNHRKI